MSRVYALCVEMVEAPIAVVCAPENPFFHRSSDSMKLFIRTGLNGLHVHHTIITNVTDKQKIRRAAKGDSKARQRCSRNPQVQVRAASEQSCVMHAATCRQRKDLASRSSANGAGAAKPRSKVVSELKVQSLKAVRTCWQRAEPMILRSPAATCHTYHNLHLNL